MIDLVADLLEKHVRKKVNLVDSDQTAAHTSQMNETGYAVIPAIVGAAELEEVARSVDGLLNIRPILRSTGFFLHADQCRLGDETDQQFVV